jgi:hypothetical protein
MTRIPEAAAQTETTGGEVLCSEVKAFAILMEPDRKATRNAQALVHEASMPWRRYCCQA